jgi:arsenite/tail-anchored protein-transporting ATPase
VLLTARPLVFYGGKGGVGKTTLAAARALVLAGEGHETLLVSTDPAHSTADLLGVPLGNTPTPVGEHLHALEIDAEADAEAYVARIKKDAAAVVSPEALPGVERHLDLARQSPGTVEGALLDRLSELIAQCPGTYERIVFDTAPTGHTLRLLALPELLTGLVEGLVRQRERVAGADRMLRNVAGDDGPADDPVLRRLRDRREVLRVTRRRLLDDAAFHLVLVPERLPIEETVRAAVVLSEAGLRIAEVVVNRVLPETVEGDFMRQRAEQQAAYLAEIDRRLAAYPRVRIRHAPRDITAPEDLDVVMDAIGHARR